jgi:hypothetical protein
MTFDNIGVPSLAINGYLWDTMKKIDPSLSKKYGTKMPFFPLGDAAAGTKAWEDKPYFTYDRVFRFSRNPFYEHKRESTFYYLKARDVESIQWAGAVQLILDRQDDSAKDINEWIRSQENWEDYPIYFHYVRIYQSRSSSPSSGGKLREETSRPYYVTEFIVDTYYHFTKSLQDYL